MDGVALARDFLRARKLAYVQIFSGPVGEKVLADLAKFCRAHETTFNADARAHAVAEGRREVWLRVQRNLQLTDEQIWGLYGLADQEPGT